MRPAFYIGQLVYFELNIDTIIQKYCVNKDKPELKCNGKCHLAKQLQMTQQNDKTNEGKATTFLLEAFFPLYFQAIAYSLNFNNVSINHKNNWQLKTMLASLADLNCFHPPEYFI
ncbi:MAG: hypothetical protein KDC68_09310 [Gelidibacter sp.]|nr:hypothetical protein [Gelidibacter sp.]